jgi:adenylylsulfate kinase
MYLERKIRSIIKAVSWRFWATLTTVALVFLFTGYVKIAFAIGGVEVIAKLLLYYLHERVWSKIPHGFVEAKPAVIWFTGLSGSGKSTIAEQLVKIMKERRIKVEHLDGDNIRDIFPKTGFSKEERDRHIKRVGYLASRLEGNGVYVVATFVSPYEETRKFVRSLCNKYVEVYVSTTFEECEKRDVKGLYAKARKGEIKNFTGLDDPYESPSNPEIVIDTRNTSVDQACNIIFSYLNEGKLNSKSEIRNSKQILNSKSKIPNKSLEFEV